MPVPKKRSYNSGLRQAQAEKTKDRILTAAKTLFETKGFEKVTIEEIAKDAEVSAPTIYALFQSKSGILRTLMDNAFSAEQHGSLVQKIKAQQSTMKRFELTAAISRQLYDAERAQLGALQGTSLLDPDFRKVELEREKRRYQRQETVALLANENDLLAESLNETKARDILWAFTGRDLYRMLVVERGWSSDEYEKWLGNLLAQTLLKQPN